MQNARMSDESDCFSAGKLVLVESLAVVVMKTQRDFAVGCTCLVFLLSETTWP